MVYSRKIHTLQLLLQLHIMWKNQTFMAMIIKLLVPLGQENENWRTVDIMMVRMRGLTPSFSKDLHTCPTFVQE